MIPKPKTNNQTISASRDALLKAAMIRLGDIDDEIQAGYNIIRKYDKTVTIFGSARTNSNDPYYQLADTVAERLGNEGYAIVSGGGHGIMGAANHGAHIAAQKGAEKSGAASIGFNIKLPFEQQVNKYATDGYEFAHFAPRKIVMTLYADAYIYFPGGFGTLDELTEILTLIQTGKTNKAPIILVGKSFWGKFDEFVKEELVGRSLISSGDEKLYTITDSVDQIVSIVKSNTMYHAA